MFHDNGEITSDCQTKYQTGTHTTTASGREGDLGVLPDGCVAESQGRLIMIWRRLTIQKGIRATHLGQ